MGKNNVLGGWGCFILGLFFFFFFFFFLFFYWWGFFFRFKNKRNKWPTKKNTKKIKLPHSWRYIILDNDAMMCYICNSLLFMTYANTARPKI